MLVLLETFDGDISSSRGNILGDASSWDKLALHGFSSMDYKNGWYHKGYWTLAIVAIMEYDLKIWSWTIGSYYRWILTFDKWKYDGIEPYIECYQIHIKIIRISWRLHLQAKYDDPCYYWNCENILGTL